MKNLIVLSAILATTFGCAAFQGQPSKVDKIQDAIECRLDLLKPYEATFTLENLKLALAGQLDPVETLRALDIDAEDIFAFKAGWEKCVAEEKAE